MFIKFKQILFTCQKTLLLISDSVWVSSSRVSRFKCVNYAAHKNMIGVSRSSWAVFFKYILHTICSSWWISWRWRLLRCCTCTAFFTFNTSSSSLHLHKHTHTIAIQTTITQIHANYLCVLLLLLSFDFHAQTTTN